MQHPGTVSGVAFEPAGGKLLTGCADGNGYLWQTLSFQQLDKLEHGGAVLAVAYSRDGTTVAIAGADKKAKLFDLSELTPKEKGNPVTHGGPITSVAFSPNGQLLLTGSQDKTARIWRTNTGELITDPLQHNYHVTSVAFSGDAKTVATGSADGTARLWETETGKPLGKPMQHPNAVTSVAVSGDGKTLLTGCKDNTARLWETSAGKKLLQPQGISAANLSLDGKFAVTAGKDKTARIWDAVTGAPIGEPLKHDGPVTAVAISRDGKLIATRCWRQVASTKTPVSGTPRRASCSSTRSFRTAAQSAPWPSIPRVIPSSAAATTAP
jgi:WD40 repeat protein